MFWLQTLASCRKTFLCAIFFSFFFTDTRAQSLNWAFNTGGAFNDGEFLSRTRRDAAGKLYQTGVFNNASIDVDPGPGVYSLMNTGGYDGFVAWYTPTGAFVNAIRIGGANNDGIMDVAVDASGNIYVTGYFNDMVDFDPSGANYYLTSNGGVGSCTGNGGDVFVAKYTATGALVWAFNIGGIYCYDAGISIDVSPNGSVYVCGAVNMTNPVDFDPSPAVYNLNGTDGMGFVAKYRNNGQFVGAFNFGGAFANSSGKTVRVDHQNGSLFVSGHAHGACDMDPSATASFFLSGTGENAFLARYDTSLNFQFAMNIPTAAVDEALDMALDADNVYLAGYVEGANIDFDPGVGSTSFNTGGQDAFIAKYTKAGQYRWARLVGGASSDNTFGISVNGNHVYTTGSFGGTADFDASASVYNLTSAGQSDGYVLKQDTAGNFICAFRFGGALNDLGYHVTSYGADQVLLTGAFQNAALMTPAGGTPVTLNSNGSLDLLLANYTWNNNCNGIVADTIINKYAAVLNADFCENRFTVDTATGFNPGDTVLVIQMKGAVIDTTNTASFGNMLDYRNAGNYEINVIDSKVGNNIKLKYQLKRQYNIPDGKVQFVRVPHFQDYTVAQPHTCLPWNGSKGGVFIIDVANTLTLNDHVDVSGKGFRGAQVNNGTTYTCDMASYFYPMSGNDAGRKGESIAEVSAQKGSGKGALASGGGGGNSANAGGGGGGNAGAGGKGGFQWIGCSASPVQSGLGGVAPGSTSGTTNKIYMGGGGGAGHENNYNTDRGGNGGGIILINAGQLRGNSKNVSANGEDCPDIKSATPPIIGDGQSGGGGGGSILLSVNAVLNTTNVNTRGGNGGDVFNLMEHGPGGGGGGGFAWFKIPFVPLNAVLDQNGGKSGHISNGSAYGAQDGVLGVPAFNLVIPVANVPFAASNIVAGFSHTANSCRSASFTDLSVTAIAGWQWSFGDNTGSAQQHPSHTYPGPGTYQVKLVVTDSNGCKDSITQTITLVPSVFADAGPDTSSCSGRPASLHASGGVSYQWSPAGGLSNPSIANPLANPAVTTHYVVTVTDAAGCIDHDTVVVTALPAPVVVITPDEVSGCAEEPVQLSAAGAVHYQWSPAEGLSDPAIHNPIASPAATTVYTVIGTDGRGCTGQDFISVAVHPAPLVDASSYGEPVSCSGTGALLRATGAVFYVWRPGAYLNDSTSANPVATPPGTTLFVVEGKDEFGCVGTDTITVRNVPQSVVFMPDAFTPNGDGRNDRIYPIIYCEFIFESFHIYNRWGQRVFSTPRYRDGWDGRFNGSDADMGTYNYFVRGHRPNGEEVIRKGTILLIR